MQLYLVTDNDGFFQQHLNRWKSLDIDFISTYCKSKGIDCRTIRAQEVPNIRFDPAHDVVWATSHHIYEKRRYIIDVLSYLHLRWPGLTMYPDYELFLCHENKGMQELVKQQKGIEDLLGTYLQTFPDENEYSNNNQWPVVGKKNEGSGSFGVFLIENEEKLRQTFNEQSKLGFTRWLKYLRHYFKDGAKMAQLYKKYYTIKAPFVLQPFVQNLEYDYKVLVFQDKFYCLTRYNRKNDFRASGSGNLEFLEAPKGILDIAEHYFNYFDSPFLSLDLCYDGKQFHLIEFQGPSFGPYTMVKAPWYYRKENNKWQKYENTFSLEEVFTDSVIFAMIEKGEKKVHT